jgi:hypothetical protein
MWSENKRGRVTCADAGNDAKIEAAATGHTASEQSKLSFKKALTESEESGTVSDQIAKPLHRK